MTHSSEEDWRQASDKILSIVSALPAQERLGKFKELLVLLPESKRPMVEHFVYMSIIFSSSETDTKAVMNKNFHLSIVSGFTLVVALALIVAGVYIVFIRGDLAASKINILGATIETGSIGVACLFIAAVMFLFTIKSIVSKF